MALSDDPGLQAALQESRRQANEANPVPKPFTDR